VPETLVLLHGFSGPRRAWDGVMERFAGERIGRTRSISWPRRQPAGDGSITFASCVEAILAQAPRRFALCGYSMGGRVALHVALAAPERVSRLTLVSCTAGIEDDAERAARRASDRRLADELERSPFEQFIERWGAQPVFAGDPPDVVELAREDQRRNDPRALAAAMRGIGTGEMTPLWRRLGELAMPTAVVVGDRDAKFTAIGRRMAAQLPVGELIVLRGGHRLALENPAELARAV
jgi:2-succinyl-6-hydroxy-2,4-cyclohexadiene-1-carboxylate synthase